MSNGRVEKKDSLLLEINNLTYQSKMERFGEFSFNKPHFHPKRISHIVLIRLKGIPSFEIIRKELRNAHN